MQVCTSWIVFTLTTSIFGGLLCSDIQWPTSGGVAEAGPERRKAAPLGGSRILECPIVYKDGQWHEHVIRWHKQGIEVPILVQYDSYQPHLLPAYQGRLRLVEQASVELSDIRTSDEGWYQCSVIFITSRGDPENSPYDTWIYLAVHSPPVLGQVSPGFLMHKLGDTVDLYCEATGIPTPVLVWMKDGEELTSASAPNNIVVNGNRVHVRQLERSLGGVYSCTFKNVVGQAVHTMRLVIEGNAYIISPPKNTTVMAGQQVKLTCLAEGYPNNITYTWLRNGADLRQTPALLARTALAGDGTLIIDAVRKEDIGWYKCRPSNGIGQAPEAQAFLNVTYLPRVEMLPSRQFLPRGLHGKLDCPVDANPPPYSIEWLKNEKPLEESMFGGRLAMDRQGSLVFKTVETGDEGRYTCLATSNIGKGSPSSVIHVVVSDPPTFVVRPRRYYQREEKQSVTMPCVADGDPKPQVTWRRADRTAPLDQSRLAYEGSNLTFRSLTRDDQGTYECVATSMVADVITSTVLYIEGGAQHGPVNVTAQTTETTAKVTWLPAYDGGQFMHYTLWYKAVGVQPEQEWQTTYVKPDDATAVTVINLHPHQTYQFMVLARTKQGPPLYSTPIERMTRGFHQNNQPQATATGPESDHFQTEHSIDQALQQPAGVPPGPPCNISAHMEGKNLLIYWQHHSEDCSTPAEEAGEGVTGYRIEYRTVGKWAPLYTTNREATRYNWTTASYSAKYRFHIFALGHGGAISEASDEIVYETKDPTEKAKIESWLLHAIMGAMGGLFVTVFLLTYAIKLCSRYRRERSVRYGAVKCYGAQCEDNGKAAGCPLGLPLPDPPEPPAPFLDNHHLRVCDGNGKAPTTNVKETPI